MRAAPHERPPVAPRAGPRRLIAICALLPLAIIGCQSAVPHSVDPEVSDADRARFARRRLEDGRALVAEGRLDAAERNLRRGLAILPDDAALHRDLARVLEAQGHGDEAARHRARGDALDPAEVLPAGPALGSAQGVLVALIPPQTSPELHGRVPEDWPNGAAAQTLRDRLRVRLPGATVVHTELQTVAEARRWLPRYAPRVVISLRVERSFCGESLKDGAFAVAWLRAAAERPTDSGQPARRQPPRTIRKVVVDPSPPESCVEQAVAGALERVLADGAVKRSLEALDGAAVQRAPGFTPRWSRASIRALFPGIGQRLTEEIETGRIRLANGEIAAAAEAFQRAVHIDPEDPFARTYLGEAESTLAMVRELAGSVSAGPALSGEDADSLDPRVSPAQAAAAEARLREERRRRDELLAVLAVLDEDVQMPSRRMLATLRPTRVRDASAFGPTLARERAGGEIEARAAYAPDGSVLARYYYPAGGDLPLVREEDTNGDDVPDRWIGYSGTQRAEIWEDGRGIGRPDLRFVFASGGTPLEKIEIDADYDGRPERVFHYADGILHGEDRDTNGDGSLDCFDRLDPTGGVSERAEDLNGDGDVDVRSIYRDGRLVRREIENPDLAGY